MRREQIVGAEKLDIRTELLRFAGDLASRQAFIETAGQDLRDRYDKCEAGFQGVLAFIGGEMWNGDMRSWHVVIGRGVNNVRGYHYPGSWAVQVIERDAKTRQETQEGRPEYMVVADFLPDNGDARFGKAEAREYFGSRFAFWAVDKYGWSADILSNAARDYERPVERAEDTLQMIWDALRNPDLNPEFAERALSLQRA